MPQNIDNSQNNLLSERGQIKKDCMILFIRNSRKCKTVVGDQWSLRYENGEQRLMKNEH